VRLAEEGVNNVQALVRHDLVSLLLRTRIPVSRLVDWADQAILYLHTDPSDEVHHQMDRRALAAFGLRTATDFVAAIDSNPNALKVIAEGYRHQGAVPGATPSANATTGSAAADQFHENRLQLIYEAAKGEPLYRTVEHWRKSSQAAPEVAEFWESSSGRHSAAGTEFRQAP
jgi:hypothetical protein